MPSPRQPFAENEAAPTDPVVAFVARHFSGKIEPGYGYGSSVFMARDAVLKIDPVRDRRGIFKCDSVADGLDLRGVATPKILNAGEIDGHEWIEISRIHGNPAYLNWLDYTEESRQKFMWRLCDTLAEWRQIVPGDSLVKSASDALFTTESAREQLAAATPFMPTRYVAEADALLSESEALEAEQGDSSIVLIHGDLWLGNMIASERGDLVGIIDFGRAAMAPAQAELDMLFRFWRTPWLFVPEEWEPRYREAQEWALLGGIIADCTTGLSEDAAALRLATYDVAYRLKKIADWGWSGEQEQLFVAATDVESYRHVIRTR